MYKNEFKHCKGISQVLVESSVSEETDISEYENSVQGWCVEIIRMENDTCVCRTRSITS